MKKKYSIAFLGIMIIAGILISEAYQISYEKAKERARAEVAKEEKASVAAQGNALEKNCFYLLEVNGYVVVYLSDKKTVYEYTSILVENLPAELQNEIKNGKYMKGEKELYGFLENYTS